MVHDQAKNWQVGGGSPSHRSAEERERGWQLGFQMHPNWLDDSTAEEFLLPLRQLGLRVLEFTLNLSSPDWPEMHLLIEQCQRLGFQFSFHAPFKGPYNPAGFSTGERKKLECLFRPAIDYAARIAKEAGPTNLVVHGARGKGPREELCQDTKTFLGWIVEEAPDLRPAIELLYEVETTCKIGDNKAELVELVSALNSSKIGICWDLGHNVLGGSLPVPPGFLALVTHVHVHDIGSDGKDHYPLLYGKVPHEEYLHQLVGVNYRKPVILELNRRLVALVAEAEGKPVYQILQTCFRTLNQPTPGH